jgi:Tol biopolymer transport system component
MAPEKPKRTHIAGIPITGRIGRFYKTMFVLLAVIVLCLSSIAISMITSIDTALIKPSLQGTITATDTSEPIAGVLINMYQVISGESNEISVTREPLATFTTDASGKYSFGNLNIGRYVLEFSSDEYENQAVEVAVSRSFLNYTNTRDFQLTPTGIATIKGKIVVSDNASYDFADDRIVIAEKEYALELDGSFNITDAETGTNTFYFKSSNYIDVERALDLELGTNDLGEIQVEPAGDIVGMLQSWLREELVLDMQITVETVDPKFVTINSNGEFRVRDLVPTRSYRVRFSHPDYVNRDYEIGITQGDNAVFGLRIVENGMVPFQRRTDDGLQIFISEFDGGNTKQLTTERRTEAYGEFLKGNTVYFISTRDRLSSSIGGNAGIVYAIGANGGNPQRVTTNYAELGRVVPNFVAEKLASVRRGEATRSRVLDVMDLEGEGRREILSIPNGTFTDILISDDGDYVVYYTQEQTNEADGLYRAPTSGGEPGLLTNKPNLQIYSVSHDGNRILYSAPNNGTGLNDLYLYTVSTGQDAKIRPSFTGSQYQFIRGSDTKLLFFDLRQSVSDVYLLDTDTNSEKKITNFHATEGVEAVYQQAGYILYQTNKGLYAMDPEVLVPGKLVTSDVARYTGYDF